MGSRADILNQLETQILQEWSIVPLRLDTPTIVVKWRLHGLVGLPQQLEFACALSNEALRRRLQKGKGQ